MKKNNIYKVLGKLALCSAFASGLSTNTMGFSSLFGGASDDKPMDTAPDQQTLILKDIIKDLMIKNNIQHLPNMDVLKSKIDLSKEGVNGLYKRFLSNQEVLPKELRVKVMENFSNNIDSYQEEHVYILVLISELISQQQINAEEYCPKGINNQFVITFLPQLLADNLQDNGKTQLQFNDVIINGKEYDVAISPLEYADKIYFETKTMQALYHSIKNGGQTTYETRSQLLKVRGGLVIAKRGYTVGQNKTCHLISSEINLNETENGPSFSVNKAYGIRLTPKGGTVFSKESENILINALSFQNNINNYK